MVDSDYESDEGPFTFRRKEGVEYLAPRGLPGSTDEIEPWRVGNLSLGSEKDKFIWTHVPGVCVAYCRYTSGMY